MENFKISECTTDYEIIKNLFEEYSQIKGAESCFVSFGQELADLGRYYKGGAFLIGLENETPVACVALKKSDDKTCEIKRLFVKPQFRGKGYSRLLLNAVLDKAKSLGFETATLTTKPEVMPVAYKLYGRLGFKQIGEEDGTVSMRIGLNGDFKGHAP